MKGRKINQLIAIHTLISACAGITLAVILFLGFLKLEQKQQLIANDAVLLNDVLRMEESYRQWLIMMDLILGNEQTYLVAGAKRQATFFLDLVGHIGRHALARDVLDDINSINKQTKAIIDKQLDFIINGGAVELDAINEFDDVSASTLALLFHMKDAIQVKAQQNEALFQQLRAITIVLSIIYGFIFIAFIGAQWIILSLYLVRPVQKLSKAVAKAQKAHQSFKYVNDTGPIEIRKLAEDTRIFIKKLEEYADHAEKASLAKSDFLSVMSHEIRTPLNAIIGFSDILTEPDLSHQQHKEYIKIINQSGHSLLVLINDILDFSKIEAGKMELDPVWFDMYALLLSVMASNRHACSKKSLLINQSVDKEVPRYLYGDEQKIRQILYNLLSNAVKFTESGSISLNVSVESKKVESRIIEKALVYQRITDSCDVIISVLDTGIGIAKEQQSQLFDPFTQADVSTTRKYGGSGLGLAIVHKMATLLNGEISLSSTVGKGSEFLLRIPLVLPLQDLTEIAVKPSLISLYGDVKAVDLVEKTSGLTLASQLKQLGYIVDCIDSAKYPLLKKSDINQSTQLLLFSPECLKQALCWYENNLQYSQKISTAYCSNKIGDNKTVQQLSNMSSITITQNGFEMVEQIELLINTGSDVTNCDELTDEILVLIVEDNPVNLLMAQKILKQLGIRSISASNGQQAVNHFMSQKLTLILMDCQMPVMDGYTATKEIRQLEKQEDGHIPIIALTANAFNEDRDACFAAGMDDYLNKPFKKKQLFEVISPWLKREANKKKSEVSIEESKLKDVLDSVSVNELMAIDEIESKEFMAELSLVFFSNAEQLIEQIECAFSENSISLVAKLAHQLKSSSMNVAAKRLSELFEKLECFARQADYKQAISLWPLITEEYKLVGKAYEQLLTKKP